MYLLTFENSCVYHSAKTKECFFLTWTTQNNLPICCAAIYQCVMTSPKVVYLGKTNKQMHRNNNNPTLVKHLFNHYSSQELQRIKTLTLNNNTFSVDREIATSHCHSRPCLTQVFDLVFSDRESIQNSQYRLTLHPLAILKWQRTSKGRTCFKFMV